MMFQRGLLALLNIALLVGATIAFAHAAHYVSVATDVPFDQTYEKTVTTLLGDGRVSAADLGILQKGLPILQQIQQATGGGFSMCTTMTDGTQCVLMTTGECATRCMSGKCTQVATSNSNTLSNVPEECALGTCQDPVQGMCMPNAPKGNCESQGGKWFNDPTGNIPECRKACCTLGTEPLYTTEQNCKYIAEGLGLEFGSDHAVFDSSLIDEPSCQLLARGAAEGACTSVSLEEPGKYDCKRITREECIGETGSESNFHEGHLCTDSSLSTVCKPHDHVECMPEGDEVYWFDSCGNRENIYGSEVAGKEGLLLSKQESCVLGDPANPLQNQATCGNCNRIFSSKCMNSSLAGATLQGNPKGDAICGDLRCHYEDHGKQITRENGETWCNYQTNFGVWPFDFSQGNSLSLALRDGTSEKAVTGTGENGEENGLLSLTGPGGFNLLSGGFGGFGIRSVGPPGSTYFRATCEDGVVKNEPCAAYRNEICTETRVPKNGTSDTFSVAACRLNRWQECLNYNPKQQSAGGLNQLKMLQAMGKCALDPDCFVKYANVPDSSFQFPMCLPKYPVGSDLGGQQAKSIEGVCAFGSNECVAVFVKMNKGFGPVVIPQWECVANCGCVANKKIDPEKAEPSGQFISEMNNICTSLGDCGWKQNYKGALPGGTGFQIQRCVSKDPKTCNQKRTILPIFSILQGVGINAIFNGYALDFVKPGSDRWIQASSRCAMQRSIGASLDSVGDIGSFIQTLTGGANFFGPAGSTVVYGDNGVQLNDACANAASSGAADPSTTLGGTAGGTGTTSQTGQTGVGQFYNGPSAQLNIYRGRDLPALGGISGGATLGLVGAAHAGWLPTSFASFTASSTVGGEITSAGLPLSEAQSIAGSWQGGVVSGPQYSAFGGALIGAGIGFAATSILIAVSGIGPGLGAFQTYTLAGMGAASGGLIGYAATSESLTVFGSTTGLLGVGLGVFVVASVVVNWISGIGEIKYVHMVFNCKPWEQPRGGGLGEARCEKCGSDGLPCSPYACAALGASCAMIGDVPNQKCVDIAPNDVSGPRISPWEEIKSSNIQYIPSDDDRGFGIQRVQEPKCITQFEAFTFGVKLSEYGKCKLAADPTAQWENMRDLGSSSWEMNHSLTLQSFDIMGYLDDEELSPTQEKDVTLYVKCIDVKGNPSPGDYAINLCLIGKDLTAPYLLADSNGNQYLPFEQQTYEAHVHSNEAVELRWSLSDVPFDEMEHTLTCSAESGLTDCIASIPITDETTTIYVRGRDHPEWAGTDREGERNTNQQSTTVIVHRAESALQVSNVQPNSTITIGTLQASIEIFADTSGGVDGNAHCQYSMNGGILFDFQETGGSHHRSREPISTPGAQQLAIVCTDVAGDRAGAISSFTVIQDLNPPTITRVYNDNGQLTMQTDEYADCAFMSDAAQAHPTCGFAFENGTSMSNEGNGLMHRTNFDESLTYYIKCKDRFGTMHATNECSIIAKGILLQAGR